MTTPPNPAVAAADLMAQIYLAIRGRGVPPGEASGLVGEVMKAHQSQLSSASSLEARVAALEHDLRRLREGNHP